MTLRSRRHTSMHCPLPPHAMDGDVWECDTCGRLWRYRSFPNPDFAGWRQTLWSYLFRGPRWFLLRKDGRG
jgi:hypothetical protein